MYKDITFVAFKMQSTYNATVTLGPSLQRTTLLLPPRPKPIVASSDTVPALPAFRVRSAGGDKPPLNVSILRRSIHTQRMLRTELRSILSERSGAASLATDSKAHLRVHDGHAAITAGAAMSTATDDLLVINYVDSRRRSDRPPTGTSAVRSLLVGLIAKSVPPSAGPSPRVSEDVIGFSTDIVDQSLTASSDDTGGRGAVGTYLPYRPHDRFVDTRPPSRGRIALFREKLHRDLEAALPQALLDGDVAYSAGSSSMQGIDGQPTALPHNLLIPCVSRYPEAVHGPTGVESVAKEVGAIRQPPPTSYVRELQRQSQMDSPGRTTSTEFQRKQLRPRSVDVLLGGRPCPPEGFIVVLEPPTQATITSRRRVASSRKAFRAQQAVGRGDDAHDQGPALPGRPWSSLQ